MTPTAPPVPIAVFDLNQALYRKSSKEEFYKFICFKHETKLFNLVRQRLAGLAHRLGLMGQTEFKENFFRYLDGLPPEKVAEYAREFWHIEYPKHFNAPLLTRLRELQRLGIDVWISSGAFEVYLLPLGEYLDITGLFGTRVAYRNGKYQVVGQANKDGEKIRRFDGHYGSGQYRIVEAYSDGDASLLAKADKGYTVEPDGSWHLA
ncbi:Phosphoserine phosphatase [Catalinimonas alkaloidigena]|uniref:Phosphoserine phosphatase n=1 Tax=Catalinimonas alkaloidigena TaxID=1075417 RepID=A0A1G9ELS5_9BACT|nr:haloacid dehalogenase-like hydrolase [Catalinimonas alkaloidigena]SDK77147.1 Phosphoserine phosphatase [Catalinimonas alkaloidigena]